MQNELGQNGAGGEHHAPFAINTVKEQSKDMDIDIFKPVNLDNIPGGMDSIQILVKEALAKELVGIDDLKKLRIEGDQLFLNDFRFVQSREIFAD